MGSHAEQELVSVVVPARNEERSVGPCLDSILRQDYRTIEVLVVDGDSSDGTVAEVHRRMAHDDRIRLLHNPRHHIPSSLNLALSVARGRWLVRVDAHSTVGVDYVATAVARLREGWGGVGGRKDGVGVTAAGRAIAVAMGSRLGVGGSTYHHGRTVSTVDHLAFGAYPVELLKALNGWDESLTANEDFELDRRILLAGHELLFDPRIVIHWECRQSVPDLYRQYRRYGRGKIDVLRLHPRSLHPRHLGPPALVAYAVTSAIVGVRSPVRAAAALSPYALAVLAGSLLCARQLREPQERMWLPAAFVAMHVGWGVGFWERTFELAGARARNARYWGA